MEAALPPTYEERPTAAPGRLSDLCRLRFASLRFLLTALTAEAAKVVAKFAKTLPRGLAFRSRDLSDSPPAHSTAAPEGGNPTGREGAFLCGFSPDRRNPKLTIFNLQRTTATTLIALSFTSISPLSRGIFVHRQYFAIRSNKNMGANAKIYFEKPANLWYVGIDPQDPRSIMKNLRSFGLLVALSFLCVLSASAKDQWITVRSQNFFLVGNASEKDIQKVALKMEQFRATFRLIFPKTTLSSGKPTNIVVFKSTSAYKPFLPRRKDGKADTGIAGYFQPGEDVNYITLSTEGEDDETFKVIFHEYVHSLIDATFGRSEIPAWLNEGLAEYYSTFRVEKGNQVYLGYPILEHANFLARNGILHLSDLFKASSRDIHANGGRTRQAFYAESWALVHCLMTTGRNSQLSKFVAGLQNDLTPEVAFKQAFGTDYADMENQLRKYVTQAQFNYQILTLKDQLAVASQQATTPIDDAQANAYLGDLLYHSNRLEEAEPYLAKAIAADPRSILANTSMAMVKMRQNHFPEAQKYLDTAVSLDSNNFRTLYLYAYLLAREGAGLGGFPSMPAEKAKKAAEFVAQALKIKPDSAEAADLYAYIAQTRKEGLDEALGALKTALSSQPGNQQLSVRMVEVLAAKGEYEAALALAKKIAANPDDEQVGARASSLASRLTAYIEQKKAYEQQAQGSPVDGQGRSVVRTLSEEDTKKYSLAIRNFSITEQLKKPGPDGDSAIGNIRKITCANNAVQYTFFTNGKEMRLTSKDLQSLELMTYLPNAGKDFGCDADFSTFKAYVVFQKLVKAGGVPTLKSVTFLPPDFEVVNKMPEIGGGTSQSTFTTAADDDSPPKLRREEKVDLEMLKQSLRQPAEGELRVLGTIRKLVCTTGDAILHFQTASGPLLLTFSISSPPKVRAFTSEAANTRINCSMGPSSFPAVMTYKPYSDKKAATAGEMVSIEFVPEGFMLD